MMTSKSAFFSTLFSLIGLVLVLWFTRGAADRPPNLEVRTFALENLQSQAAVQLIEPYVYGDREGAPGTLSSTTGAISVRETPDNLDKIARVLAEFDNVRADVRLHFQLIEADGFTDTDERISAVEVELRKVFQFRGYRLAAEAFVTATDGSDIGQLMQGADEIYEITGHVNWVGPGTVRLSGVRLSAQSSGRGLETTVNIRPGQTLILGSSPKDGSTATLLLTVRAEAADDAGGL